MGFFNRQKEEDYEEEYDEQEFQIALDEAIDLYTNGNFQGALDAFDICKEKAITDDDLYTYYYTKALILIDQSEELRNETDSDNSDCKEIYNFIDSLLEEAFLLLDEAEKYISMLWQKCIILKSKGDCRKYFEQNQGGLRRYLIGALATDDADSKKSFLDDYRTSTEYMKDRFEEYILSDDELMEKYGVSNDEDRKMLRVIVDDNKFTALLFKDRQFIFIGKNIQQISGCFDELGNINWIFTQDYIPSGIVFPLGYPQSNTLYVANPVRTNEYLPFEEASNILFLDKIRELRYLLQSLGATEINFESIRGQAISLSEINQNSTSFNANLKINKGGLNYSGSSNDRYNSIQNNRIALTQSFEPTQKPFCPDNLSWLDTDNEWKTLIKQRLEGNMLSYEQVISSKSVTHISREQMNELQGAFENFMVQIKGTYNGSSSSSFDESLETEWKIYATFKPLDEFTSNIDNGSSSDSDDKSLNTEEKRYKEEIEFCLEDGGNITDTDRKYLERKRIKFGISEDKAKEIEDSLIPSFTEDELEYIDTYKEIVTDGEISPRIRRLLERTRESLNIPPERCKELEHKIN